MRVSRLLAAATFAVTAPLACSDSTSATPVGKVSVHVVDATGAGVQLVSVDLYRLYGTDAILWRAARTSSDGIAVLGAADGGIAQGSYIVHVTFVTNFHLAAGETNDKLLTVQGGDDLVVTFQAESSGPSHLS